MTKLAEQLKQGADQAWESLSEGWRELSARASGALTRFRPAPASNATSATGASAELAPAFRQRLPGLIRALLQLLCKLGHGSSVR